MPDAVDNTQASARRMYRLPLLHMVPFGIDLLLGRRRSFVRDARYVVDANKHFRRDIQGLSHLPAIGSYILVMNHFSRRGLRPYHCAMVVNLAVAQRRPGPQQSYVRWAFTSEYIGLRIGAIPIPRWLLRWLFRRVADVYGFVIMPRREELAMSRAAAMRALLRSLSHDPIGVTPEGPLARGVLVVPPNGTGLFLASASHGEVPILPVAVWEENDVLRVRFGAPLQLTLRPNESREEQDSHARDDVMTAIGSLLPPAYWGAYAEVLARAGGGATVAKPPDAPIART